VTNLPGADLNAACSGPNGARPTDGPSNAANTEATSSMTGIENNKKSQHLMLAS